MAKSVSWIVVAALSVLIGLYPSLFFLGEKKVGILKAKPDALFGNPLWHTSFYMHIVTGGLALLIGWVQFNRRFRGRFPGFHRFIGKTYVVSVLLSAVSGFIIAFYATGGLPVALGFMCLSAVWLYTTVMAYVRIREGQVVQHGTWMVYSYACCFAAVTLRLWMPILVPVLGSFADAYALIAWLCWVPNLGVAYLLTRGKARA